MSEWQPIETAPVDEPVHLGRWRGDGFRNEPSMRWQTCVGTAWTMQDVGLFWPRRRSVRHLHWKEYTHWMPLPAPPKGDSNE